MPTSPAAHGSPRTPSFPPSTGRPGHFDIGQFTSWEDDLAREERQLVEQHLSFEATEQWFNRIAPALPADNRDETAALLAEGRRRLEEDQRAHDRLASMKERELADLKSELRRVCRKGRSRARKRVLHTLPRARANLACARPRARTVRRARSSASSGGGGDPPDPGESDPLGALTGEAPRGELRHISLAVAVCRSILAPEGPVGA